MSWDRPSGAPSPSAEGPDTSEFELSEASLIRLRGAALLEGLERHLPGSREHAEATASYAFAAAVELGLERAEAEAIREGAKLHEVGKVYVPVSILVKPYGDLNEPERRQLATVHETGYRLGLGAGIPDRVCAWIYHFGEHFDGTGPAEVAGEAIPLEARIVRAACACDSILAAPATTAEADPEGRRAHTIAELRRAAGRELDPDVVEALAAVLGRIGAG